MGPAHLTDTSPPQSEGQPARWSLQWLFAKASWLLLGQFKIPGWLGFAFAIFWGVPAWQSKIDFWAATVRSSGSHLAPLADVLTWPYLPATIALLSCVYLVAVSRTASSHSPRNAVLAGIAWSSLTLIVLASITVAGYGAIEFYIRAEIEKGRAGIPRAESPANSQQNGTDRPLYTDNPRGLTQNQQRLLIGMGEKLGAELPPFPITYMAFDGEAGGYARQFKIAFEHAAIRTLGPSEQPLSNPGLSGLYIEVDNLNSPAGRALQQALEVMDVHAKLVDDLPRFANYPLVLFVAPRPIQP
jgi:hypothetical protein